MEVGLISPVHADSERAREARCRRTTSVRRATSPRHERGWTADRWHDLDMPKISAATVADHREQRRDALLAAAAGVIRERGASAMTMADVASSAGLSRSAVYEYYRSAADLIADVLVDELHLWIDDLEEATRAVAHPRLRVETWIRAALAYVADGRHALVRAAGDAPLPPVRRAQVMALHHELAAPLVGAMRELGVSSPDRTASLVWGVVQAATRAIERGSDPVGEIDAAVAFALAGVDLAT